MKDNQNNVFDDFSVPTTSDGSYRGRKKIAVESEKHYDMKFNEKLTEVNQRLKSSKTKVTIKSDKGGLQLVATLPLKPGDTSKEGRSKKQYKISLGIPANLDGLKTAEEEAYELGKLIARQIFTWNDKYLGVRASKNKGITFNEFYEKFEDRYFEKRKQTIKSQNTISKYLSDYRRYFLGDEIINALSLAIKIELTNKPYARKNAITLANVIKQILQINADFNGLKIYEQPKERNIPSDNEILDSIYLFEKKFKNSRIRNKEHKEGWRFYKIYYALMAIYGLRPREILNNPDLNWLISPENIYNTFKVDKSNKTGYREVFPFVPEWIKLFDLKNQENIEILKKYSQSWEDVRQLGVKISSYARAFNRSGIPFQPYDLRHACAIRAHLQGMPIKAAADNLGHTVEIHTKVYQRWFGLENRRKAFEQTFEGLSELDKLKDENAKLRKKNAELELEVTRLISLSQNNS